jgi:hypothetical protein
MAVQACWRTIDGRYVVYIHEHQRAELCAVQGRSRPTILGPAPLYRITDRLVEFGYTWEQLRPE